MREREARALTLGREAWKELEHAIYGSSRDRVFEDMLDMALNAHLGIAWNFQNTPDTLAKLAENALTGPYEDRYMAIVRRYPSDKKIGKRPIDHMARAWALIERETNEHQADVLGEIYENMITFGEHGQYFTPPALCQAMAMMQIDDDTRQDISVQDCACGSGRMLLAVGKMRPHAYFEGVDADSRCAKMCVLNMMMFGLRGRVLHGNSLTLKFHREWRVLTGGWILEREIAEGEMPLSAKQTLDQPARKQLQPPAVPARPVQPTLFEELEPVSA